MLTFSTYYEKENKNFFVILFMIIENKFENNFVLKVIGNKRFASNSWKTLGKEEC